MRGYLARISLLLALCRCCSAATTADGAGDRSERVEVEDVEGACTLVGYFKVHAKRVYAELREADPLDVLGEELKAFLEEEGGQWAGTPTELREELMGRDAEGVPANAVNLTKRVLAIAGRSAGLEARRGKSNGTRTLRLTLKSTVRTVPSDPVPASDGVSRDTRASKSERQADGTRECNSPADFPTGSVRTVRTSRKTAHSSVGGIVRIREAEASGEDLEGFKELLADPPEWLRRQVRKYLEDPREGTLEALCTAVAYEIFGDPRRGQEVRPALEEALEKWESP